VKIRILDTASQDLIDGARFYEKQEEGLGSYFIDSLFSDIRKECLLSAPAPVY